jgi:acetyltransferase-like isoleucine patch superfamily enzyme
MPLITELREQLKGPNINIGAYTYASGPVNTNNMPCPITIGKFCSIAPGLEFNVGGGHHLDCGSTYPFDNLDNWPEANRDLYPHHKGLEIIIGNDVWIGLNVAIMHNSPIGDGAVIGAYSVVRERVRPYAIVIGNPAQEVGRRFDDETVEKLLEIKWWDFPEDKIRANMEIITSPNVEALFNG